MSEPQAYLNGKFLPVSQATVPLYDTGFVQGATVTEQVRTFGGKLFLLDRHLARLWRSLEIVGIETSESRQQMTDIAERLVATNHALLDQADDVGLSIFITPGPYATLAPHVEARPTVCLHTYPLPFRLWADKYEQGESLAVTEIEQVPQTCWPPELKCRSRMHYYLADRRARQLHPGSRALMLNQEGLVMEASTANVLAVDSNGRLLSPSQDDILHGTSLQFVIQLAKEQGIAFEERDLRPTDLAGASEVLLSSSPNAVLPVTRLDGRPIGDGKPGAIYRRLLAAWSDAVGVDVASQAKQFANRV